MCIRDSSSSSSSSLRELCFANERHSESHACVCVKGGGYKSREVQVRFGNQIGTQRPQASLRPIIDSFPRGCVGQDLLLCKETRESTDLAKCKKNKKTLFSEPPFLRRAKVWKIDFSFFWFSFLSVFNTSKSAIWQFFLLVPDSFFRRE